MALRSQSFLLTAASCLLLCTGCNPVSLADEADGGVSSTSTSSGQSVTGFGCANPSLQVLFNPAYSAFDGVHTFRVPLRVKGDADAATPITWVTSEPSLLDLAVDFGGPGVLLTPKAPGSVLVKADQRGPCGLSTLTVTSATPDQWTAGEAIYNGALAGAGKGCVSCHEANSPGAYHDVSHTPRQAGGFSDAELMGIFTQGTLPPGAPFDPSEVSPQSWSQWHRYSMNAAQAQSLVVFLRSLAPVAK